MQQAIIQMRVFNGQSAMEQGNSGVEVKPIPKFVFLTAWMNST